VSRTAREILEARAEALATVEPEAPGVLEALTLFRLLGQLCAVRSGEVDSAGQLRELSPVPGGPAWLVGATLHRGAVLSLVDLAALWELPAPGVRDLPSFVVVTHGGRRLGVLVDQLLGNLELEGALIPYRGPARAGLHEVACRGAEPIWVISTAALLSDDRLGG
jgi:purine-binding chemotaxis protein CheW